VNAHVVSATAFTATIAWQTTAPAVSRAAYGVSGADMAMWTAADAAATDHQAVLPGLSPATPYHVVLDATSSSGDHAAAGFDFQTSLVPETVTAATSGGALVLDGQPFFPLLIWGQCPDSYETSLAAGIDLFAQNPCGGLDAQIAALQGRALVAGVVDEPGGGGVGFVGWFYPDEADGLGATGETLAVAPAGPEQGRVRFLTLTNHFYSGAAPLPAGRDIYPGLIARADVVGFDLYPLQTWCNRDRIVDVDSAQRELVQLSAGRPTFQWIEAGPMGCPHLPVTPRAVRAESLLAIVGGAHGLGFFPAQWSPAVGGAIAAMARDVKTLAPALLQPEAPVEAAPSSVRVTARSYGGALYVIAVNPGRASAQTTISVPGLGGRTLTVLDEQRQIASDGDSFADALPPLAARIYVAPPA
jgi:hypothetical protein